MPYHQNNTCSFPIGYLNVSLRVKITEEVNNELSSYTRDLLEVRKGINRKKNSHFTLSGEISILIFFTVASTSGQQEVLSRRRTSSVSSLSSSPSSASAVRVSVVKETSPEFPFWQQNWFICLLFVMALGFLSLAVFLFLTLDSDYGYSTPASAASGKEGVEITYGSAIKLMHERTKFRLHSHDVPYGSGSGQQSVTGFPGVSDSNSYWIVKPVPGTTAKQGDVIKTGATIRLQHMKTRKWLHSHLHASPISGNLEISCFGDDTNSDTGDHWKLIIEGSGKIWKQDQKVRLQHIDTSGYLHSHDKKYQRIAGGQQEVCGIREKKADNIWLAAEGAYLPINESSK